MKKRNDSPTLDIPNSLAIAKTIEIEKRACYKNALLAYLTNKDVRQGWYVEGFAVLEIFGARLPLEHGWIQLPDGRVIDVTSVTLGHANVAYFPALRLSQRQARKLVDTEQPLPVMLSQRTPRHLAAYRKAQKQAHKAAFGMLSIEEERSMSRAKMLG